MDLEKTAIERIRTASQMSLQHYGLPLVVTDSGGKDSAVCRELVRRSGVPFELMHNLTTADAPQTIYYVREQFQKAEQAGITCSINKPYYKGQRITMWSLIPMKMIPPTRTIRYCCEVLKENGGAGRFITTGVRWAESRKRRKNRGIYENFVPNGKKRAIILNMIMMIPGGSLNHACQGANTYAIPLLTGVTSRSGSISRQRKYP